MYVMQLVDPTLDIHSHKDLLSAVRMLISEDRCEGRFVFGRLSPAPPKKATKTTSAQVDKGGGGDNSKSQLQTILARAGHEAPVYKTRQLKNQEFRSTVVFNGLEFVGQPCNNKKQAEKDAATEAIKWLMGDTPAFGGDINNLLMFMKKTKKKQGKGT